MTTGTGIHAHPLLALTLTGLAVATPASAGSMSSINEETTEPYNVGLLPPVPVKQGIISGSNVGGLGCGDLSLLTPGAGVNLTNT